MRDTRVRGKTIYIHNPGDYVSDHIVKHRDYWEAALLDCVAPMIRGGTVIDVGAMIGNHSLYLSRYVPDIQVVAFEPSPVNMAILHANQRLAPSIVVHPFALSDSAGMVDMAYQVENKGHAVITRTDPWPQPHMRPFRARAVTLDSMNIGDVALIKIDVEWHEPQVIMGASETINTYHPLILIEDWDRRYGALLPGYEIVQAFPGEQTFLYQWKGTPDV